MPNPESSHEPDAESAESAEPLNRAERRAQRRGKKPPLPANGRGQQTGPHEPVVMPRRSGRRGNR
jgi:hypothetical protein